MIWTERSWVDPNWHKNGVLTYFHTVFDNDRHLNYQSIFYIYRWNMRRSIGHVFVQQHYVVRSYYMDSNKGSKIIYSCIRCWGITKFQDILTYDGRKNSWSILLESESLVGCKILIVMPRYFTLNDYDWKTAKTKQNFIYYIVPNS